MKKLIFALLLFITSFFIFTSLNGCGEDNNPLIPVSTHKGAFVLYEGMFGQPQSFDYGFINLENSTVNTNVFQNSNNGANLNSVPDGMITLGGYLFVTAQGNFGGQGTIYKIDAVTNSLMNSKNIGLNPYSLAGELNGNLYVTNTAGNYITVLDTSFNILQDNITVGSSPSEIVLYGDYLYIAKQSYTSEYSLAVMNKNSYNVNKIFFNTPPVCVEKGDNKIFVSTYTGKKIYTVNIQTNTVTDSIALNISEPAIGNIVSMNNDFLLVMGVEDTSFASNIGKRIYKLNLQTGSVDTSFNIRYTGVNDTYGMGYNISTQQLYIANSKSGSANGEINVYDNNGILVKNYPDIGGKFPKRIAFINF